MKSENILLRLLIEKIIASIEKLANPDSSKTDYATINDRDCARLLTGTNKYKQMKCEYLGARS